MKKIFFTILFCFFCSMAHSVGCDDAAIEGCWTFDGSTYTDDISANGRNLTAGTGASESTTGCVFGDCIDFDGSANQITAPAYNADFEDYSRTQMVWFNSDDEGYGNSILVFGISTTTDRRGAFCFITATTSYLSCQSYNSGANFGTVTYSTDVVDGSWHHVAHVATGVWGNEDLELFVDGVSRGTADTANGSDFAGTSKPYIGDTGSTWFEEFDGKMDEFAHFSDSKNSTYVNDIMDNGLVQSSATYSGRGIGRGISRGVMR